MNLYHILLNEIGKELVKVINLYSGPGVGKSTSAAGLFHYMKTQNQNVELVTEVAKDYVWSEHFKMLESYQLEIFAEQNHRLERLRGKVDWAIVDSPLLLSHVFCPEQYYQSFHELVDEVYASYNNVNIIIQRDMSQFDSSGRVHTKEQSEQITDQLRKLLEERNFNYYTVYIDQGSPVEQIMDIINTLDN